MGLFHKIHQKHAVPRPHLKKLQGTGSRSRLCRIEQMEPRQLLSATPVPIQIGAVYFEDSHPHDEVGDVFEITFNGGAPGTQLTELLIDTDKQGNGLSMGDAFFDTESGGLGAYGSSPFSIVSQTGIDSVSAQVVDGGTKLRLTFTGFDPGEKLVFSIDVDEQGFLAPNAVAEGGEFEGSKLFATFTAPHYMQADGSDIFYDAYNGKLAGTGLNLPLDEYDPPSIYMPPGSEPGPVYTAGAIFPLEQTPLPITLSGRVYEDFDIDNRQDTGEPGIQGVELALDELVGSDYVATGRTTTTDGNGDYEFTNLLPGTYRVVETQPVDYLSVGATAGTVDGITRGVVTSVDVLSSINLDGGDDSIHNDFAETLPAELSGFVYHDVNDNGEMEFGEDGIGEVHLVVENTVSHATYDAYTDALGYWFVGDLMPGSYKVTEYQPSGWIDGKDAVGTAGGTADNPPPGDQITGIYLVGGQSGQEYDFGELKSACVSGYVYVDANDNGTFDDGETPIPGVTLTLLDSAGNPTSETRVTDDTGFYRFCGLRPGTYGVVEAQPSGYYDGKDAPGTAGGTAHNPGDLIDEIPLGSGVRALHYDFGELLPASIRGRVHAELNGDCIIDPNEPLLAGVTIYLLDSSDSRIASTTTDENGKYAFVNLKPGVYGVEEIQPPAYLDSDEHVGSAGGVNSSNDKLTGANLGSGVNGVSYDFCELVPAKISGYVFQDGPVIVTKQGDPPPDIIALRDGILTPDDKRLAGIKLTLCDGNGVPLLNSGVPITTVTDADGYYEFNMLYPGVYSIVQEQPANYLPGIDTAGSNGGMVINQYASPDPGILGTLSVDPTGAAIVRITINPGDVAVEYNFSEVLVQSDPPKSPPHFPPPTPTPPMQPPVALPFVEYRPVGMPYSMPPQIVMQPMFGGSGGPGGYSWHLSIIDAGQPRRDGSNDRFTQFPQNTIFDPISWTGADVNQSQWLLADENGNVIKTVQFGMPYAVPVTGDWDGSGTTKVGVFIDGLWFLDINGNERWDENDLWAKLGKRGDQPVSGDWDGDGKTDIGIFGPAWIGDVKAISVEPGLPDAANLPNGRAKNVPPDPSDAAVGFRTMKKGNGGRMRSDVIDHVFEYGTKGDRAVTGDWNGDGVRSIGIFRNGVWFLDMDGNGRWSDGDVVIEFGQEGDLPIVGDWTGDGISKLGVYRDGTFYLDTNNNHQIDAADKVFALGHAGDKPVAGDWTGDGIDKVGVYREAAAPEAQSQVSAE